MGRTDLYRLSEKCWQLLRRCTEHDTHANTFYDPKRDRYVNGNYNGNAYGYGYGETYSNAKDRSHTKSPAYARTPPVALKWQGIVDR